MSVKLDVGSGRSKLAGYTTVDSSPEVHADVTCDILHLPQADNTVDEIRAHHILEHIRTEDKIAIMAEFWRVLKVDGILDIEVPVFPHPASVQDPTHISFWCKESFWYFTKDNRFGEAFAKRYNGFVPLFTLISEHKIKDWAYAIRYKK